MGGTDEEGQKDKVACCYDRDTENKEKQFVFDPGFNWKPVEGDVALTCLGLRRTIRAACLCMH